MFGENNDYKNLPNIYEMKHHAYADDQLINNFWNGRSVQYTEQLTYMNRDMNRDINYTNQTHIDGIPSWRKVCKINCCKHINSYEQLKEYLKYFELIKKILKGTIYRGELNEN